jgi:hypothetical protein
MTLGYSSDRYWVDDYWFTSFLWWVLGGTSAFSLFPCVEYVVQRENRVYVVPMEG